MKKKGLVFVGFLVVFVVAGILVYLASLTITNSRVTERDATRKADLHRLRRAFHQYQSDNASFPESDENWGEIPNLSSTYIEKIPTNPQGSSAYMYATHDGETTNDLEFAIESELENMEAGDSGEVFGVPIRVRFSKEPSSNLQLTEDYNYAITSF